MSWGRGIHHVRIQIPIDHKGTSLTQPEFASLPSNGYREIANSIKPGSTPWSIWSFSFYHPGQQQRLRMIGAWRWPRACIAISTQHSPLFISKPEYPGCGVAEAEEVGTAAGREVLVGSMLRSPSNEASFESRRLRAWENTHKGGCLLTRGNSD